MAELRGCKHDRLRAMGMTFVVSGEDDFIIVTQIFRYLTRLDVGAFPHVCLAVWTLMGEGCAFRG